MSDADDILDDAPTDIWIRPEPPRPPDVMNADEVADLLRVDRKTVYDAAGRGHMPHRRLGKRLVFSRTALLDWLGCKSASKE
jgi:excisionase family DNA binding protein